ncbi:hypothetical protein RAJCM14343_4762 [Rhodococcus aetherivorans]|uniref:Antirestriction protein ArdA n=1 Tax=Rhodococcus aetherivorans TaxID=191292 RepID=A0ABQ0YT96_9NOCA|nr:antirestriction protein ArdA [Rhodococcus aetherivorans]ETT24270.1 Antirestriction ArdA family protein [Rhodococcus rhodochrous ATCC 21198]MDV6295224.1 antirestriction protein ArdA [Rhodococcus aetherivorans]NGP28021.1 hypothetical protein [Rhodococcus aetherivorans]GES39489.1 hypothetical protein RAJCM14343_4762 [Rhodococcus aetherivorans]
MEYNPFPDKHEHHWTDADLIDHELEAASEEERDISDAAARVIASQWHGGQASDLYSFVSTGEISDGIQIELAREIADAEEPDRDHLAALSRYLMNREDTGAVEGWSDLWLQAPDTEREPGDNCAACGNHWSSPHSPECPLNTDEPETTPTSAYIELFGDDPALLAQFNERYLGTFASLAAYAQAIISGGDMLRALDEAPIPDDLREYIHFDYAALGKAWEVAGEIVTAETDDGRIYVFSKRA